MAPGVPCTPPGRALGRGVGSKLQSQRMRRSRPHRPRNDDLGGGRTPTQPDTGGGGKGCLVAIKATLNPWPEHLRLHVGQAQARACGAVTTDYPLSLGGHRLLILRLPSQHPLITQTSPTLDAPTPAPGVREQCGQRGGVAQACFGAGQDRLGLQVARGTLRAARYALSLAEAVGRGSPQPSALVPPWPHLVAKEKAGASEVPC